MAAGPRMESLWRCGSARIRWWVRPSRVWRSKVRVGGPLRPMLLVANSQQLELVLEIFREKVAEKVRVGVF